MSEHVDQVLTSLKVISMIKEGQKVCVRNGLLDLEPKSTGLYVALKRWLNSDNRHTTIMYIKNVVNNALEISKLYTDEKISEALVECLTGLSSLLVTYGTDASVTATIQVIQNRIKKELGLLEKDGAQGYSGDI
jgi:hypothetical protein